MDPILIIGLGNPGPDYRGTWHNLGFRALEKLAEQYKITFRPGKGEYLLAQKDVVGRKVYLLKPLSYMNLSGRPVLDFVEREDLFHENILAVCDDVNLPLGRIRLRGQGSEGGHKGLSSIIYYLGTENFPRLRLGIAQEGDMGVLTDYVLSEIPEKQIEATEEMLNRGVEALDSFIRKGLNAAMTEFNRQEEPSLRE